MPRERNIRDLTTLQMALVGYQIERQKIDEKIREIEGLLKGQLRVQLKRTPNASGTGAAASRKAPAKRRELSAAARKRIAAAQKKRWAEHRKRMAQAAKEG
jgi:hypothetical protein